MDFRRLSHYEAGSRSRSVWLYLALIIAVAAIIISLGGIRPSPKLPTLTAEDAVQTDIHGHNSVE